MPWHNDQVSDRETAKIITTARACLGCAGDFVELGCYKGDTSLLLAEVLRGTSKQLWLYDSFAGLPEKTAADTSALGEDFQPGVLAANKRELKKRFLRAGLPVPHITKAWFKDLTPTDLPAQIAFAFLDGDLYESIRDGLRLIDHQVRPSGTVLVHDYHNAALPGVTKAVDEWAKQTSRTVQRYESLAIIRFCDII